MSAANTLNVIGLLPGTHLQTTDGCIVEVLENPEDGVWLICRTLSDPARPNGGFDDKEPVFAQDIAGLAD